MGTECLFWSFSREEMRFPELHRNFGIGYPVPCSRPYKGAELDGNRSSRATGADTKGNGRNGFIFRKSEAFLLIEGGVTDGTGFLLVS